MKTLHEVTKDARAHLIAITAERQARPSGLHADDHRVATEIAGHLYQLGCMEKELREWKKRCLDDIARADCSIGEVRGLYTLLQKELDIATHREQVVAQAEG